RKTINTTNVKNLVPRAVYTHGASTLGSFETTPIVVAGIMYITSPATPNNIVRAFDLRTQKMLWHYEHKNGPVSTACCGPNNRGVAGRRRLVGPDLQDHARRRRPEARHRQGKGRLREVRRRLEDRRRLDVDDAGLR